MIALKMSEIAKCRLLCVQKDEEKALEGFEPRDQSDSTPPPYSSLLADVRPLADRSLKRTAVKHTKKSEVDNNILRCTEVMLTPQ